MQSLVKANSTNPAFNKPAYHYIRESDQLPTIAQAIAAEDAPDFDGHIAKVKLFALASSWTWYVLAYDPETSMAYCLVDGDCLEYGDVNMRELASVRSFGLPIERDLHFTPTNAHEISR